MVEEHILKLPTPRLLAYYKKHYRGPNPHTGYSGMPPGDPSDLAQYNEFESERNALKAELDEREHVEKSK